jgi:hypothetical protein
MAFRWHVVFHKTLYPGNYDGASEEQLARHVRFVGVNDRVDKALPPQLPAGSVVLYERDLPQYDPLLQLCMLNESSVLFHAARGAAPLRAGLDFVGFLQYDMALTGAALRQTADEVAAAAAAGGLDDLVLYVDARSPAYACAMLQWPAWDELIGVFNAQHGTDFCAGTVQAADALVLVSSFGVSARVFDAMMAWVLACFPALLRHLGYRLEHVAGTLERAYGVFLALHVARRRAAGGAPRLVQLVDAGHSDDQRLPRAHAGDPVAAAEARGPPAPAPPKTAAPLPAAPAPAERRAVTVTVTTRHGSTRLR